MGKNPIPPRSTVNRQVTAPFDERGGLLGFRTSAPRMENQTQQSVAQSETKMWSHTGLLTPELCVMYVYISLQLWDTREMNPCSLQLRLARVAREKVSAVTHSCCTHYTISHLGRQLLSRGRLEAGNGRMSCSTHVFSSILDPICQNEPLQTQTKSCDCDFDGLYTVYEENRPLDNHPDETWWYDRLSLYGRGRILVIKGVPQSEEPRTLLLGFTLSFSLGAVLEEHIGKKIIKCWCLNIDPSQEPTCCDQAKTILIILKV